MLWISFLKATEQLLLYLFQALCVGEATPPELGEAAPLLLEAIHTESLSWIALLTGQKRGRSSDDIYTQLERFCQYWKS
jgi:hypothetical protein